MDYFSDFRAARDEFYNRSSNGLEEMCNVAPFDKSIVSACSKIGELMMHCNFFDYKQVKETKKQIMSVFKFNKDDDNKDGSKSIQLWQCLLYFQFPQRVLHSIEKRFIKWKIPFTIENTRYLEGFPEEIKWGIWSKFLGTADNAPSLDKDLVSPMLDMPDEYEFGFILPMIKNMSNIKARIVNNSRIRDYDDGYLFTISKTCESTYCFESELEPARFVFFFDNDRPRVVDNEPICFLSSWSEQDNLGHLVGVAFLFKKEDYCKNANNSCDKWKNLLFEELCADNMENKWKVRGGFSYKRLQGDVISGHVGYRVRGKSFKPLVPLADVFKGEFDSDCVDDGYSYRKDGTISSSDDDSDSDNISAAVRRQWNDF